MQQAVHSSRRFTGWLIHRLGQFDDRLAAEDRKHKVTLMGAVSDMVQPIFLTAAPVRVPLADPEIVFAVRAGPFATDFGIEDVVPVADL